MLCYGAGHPETAKLSLLVQIAQYSLGFLMPLRRNIAEVSVDFATEVNPESMSQISAAFFLPLLKQCLQKCLWLTPLDDIS